MAPTTVFCPNVDCHARGHIGQGNMGSHSQKEQRFLCKECHQTFSATTGTVFSRLRTSAQTVVMVVTWLAHGCPVQAIVAALGLDERPVAEWWARSARQGQAVHESLVEQPQDLGHVPADEIRVKKQGGMVWMAMAIMVTTRLWRGGEVSEPRDMTLIRRLIERVRACAVPRPIWCCVDGLSSSIRAMRETFRDPVHTGALGRPRLLAGRNICMAQVSKRYAKRCMSGIERRLVDGSETRGETLRCRSQGAGVMNTAYIERFNDGEPSSRRAWKRANVDSESTFRYNHSSNRDAERAASVGNT